MHYQLNQACTFCYIANNISGAAKFAFGAASPLSAAIGLVPRNTLDQVLYYLNSGGPSESISSTLGFFHSQRAVSTDVKLFRNGVEYDSASSASVSLPDIPLFILARNTTTIGAQLHSDHLVSVFAAGSSLSGKEAALYAAWNTYLTSI